MVNDLIFIAKRWRVVHLLGIGKLRERYARSKFGQAWLVISNLVFIVCIGTIWSLIWKMKIDEYLPYVGVGHVVYLFISQTLNDSTSIFVADSRYYLNEKMPFMMSVCSHIYRSILIFIHNIPLIIILIIWSNSAVFKPSILFFASFLILIIFLFFWSYILAAVSTRFRDLVQIFGLLFQLSFLVTPVMWKIEFVPIELRDYFMINPFAAFLEAIRNPLIGLPVIQGAYVSIIIWTLFGLLFALILHKKFDNKIIFWI